MGRIKSAIEIAMERTGEIRSDKDRIGQYEARQRGKRLANEFLGGAVRSLEDEIRKAPEPERGSLRQGAFDALSAQLSLPVTEDDVARVEAVCRGLQSVVPRFAPLAKQVSQAMNRYLDEAARYDDALRRQYAPKLRQKEEEISRRLGGQEVRLDPFQDPEFVAFYNQSMGQLKSGYQAALDQIKDEAARLFGER